MVESTAGRCTTPPKVSTRREFVTVEHRLAARQLGLSLRRAYRLRRASRLGDRRRYGLSVSDKPATRLPNALPFGAMANQRTYDVVVYGATGFTGSLVAAYLARRLSGTTTKWAIAGRNREKLEAVRARAAAVDASANDAGILLASTDDPASLLALARATTTVLTTVGPYAKYGEPLVRACIEARTHYADITGEPDFVGEMVARYDRAARDAGVRIVNCCGFDSIPHDLGALYTVKKLPRNQPMTVEAFVRSAGGFSGGTWHSAVEYMGKMRKRSQVRVPDVSPPGRRVSGVRARVRFDREFNAWAVPLPTIDPVIVLRSARALDDYGPDFRYAHCAQVKHLSTIVASGLGLGVVFGLAQFGPTRKLLLRVKDPGQGPPEAERARHWFKVTFRGTTPAGAKVLTRVRGGDPGYTETAKMVSEAALSLALDERALPKRWGVLTPAAAMGDVLIERLTSQGIVFETLDRP